MNIPDQLRPWFPINWSEHLPGVFALKAMQSGEATKDQQQVALEFIVHIISKRYEIPYFPDSERDSAFAAGRLFVGEQILKLLSLKADEIQSVIGAPKQPPKRR